MCHIIIFIVFAGAVHLLNETGLSWVINMSTVPTVVVTWINETTAHKRVAIVLVKDAYPTCITPPWQATNSFHQI